MKSALRRIGNIASWLFLWAPALVMGCVQIWWSIAEGRYGGLILGVLLLLVGLIGPRMASRKDREM